MYIFIAAESGTTQAAMCGKIAVSLLSVKKCQEATRSVKKRQEPILVLFRHSNVIF